MKKIEKYIKHWERNTISIHIVLGSVIRITITEWIKAPFLAKPSILEREPRLNIYRMSIKGKVACDFHVFWDSDSYSVHLKYVYGEMRIDFCTFIINLDSDI